MSNNINKPYLLVVGNGFDIRHNLSSQYIDFIDNEKSESVHFEYLKSMRGDLNWIDVEIEIEHLHNAINEFIIPV